MIYGYELSISYIIYNRLYIYILNVLLFIIDYCYQDKPSAQQLSQPHCPEARGRMPGALYCGSIMPWQGTLWSPFSGLYRAWRPQSMGTGIR